MNVREGDGSARVNISILQGTLGDSSISFIVLTTNGNAAGKITSTLRLNSDCLHHLFNDVGST